MKTRLRMITLLLVLGGLLFVPLATKFGQAPVSAAGFPTVTSITGSRWYYTCPSTWNNYLQVPYANRNDSGALPITLKGANLDSVYAVSIAATGYTVTIRSKSASQLVLDIRAGQPSETPKPVASPWLYLISTYGVLGQTIQPGLMPTMYVDNLSWGQCTWWAGGVRRLQTYRTVVNSYSQGRAISPDPNTGGFPRTGAVLMSVVSGHHMSFVESMSETGRVNRSDGSTQISYSIYASEYNWPCGAEKKYVTTSMVILRSRSGTYSFVTRPVVGWTVDRVAQ
jgi:hypothetical protein